MKVQIRILIIFLIFIINIIPANSIEQAQIKKYENLSLQDCVNIAINNSPIIKKYEYNLQIARSNVGIAKSAYFPTLGAGVGIYQEYNSNKWSDNGSSYREMPSANVYLRQLIWNFGKSNSLIRMEHFYKLAAEYDFMDSICNTIFDVKTKYFKVLQTKGLVEIAQNNVLINQENIKFLKKNNKSPIDIIDAEVFLSDSKIKLIDAENNYKLALADLANSLYIAYSPEFEIQNVESFSFHDSYVPKFINPTPKKETDSNIKNVAFHTQITKNDSTHTHQLNFNLNEACDLAMKNSPDLWVLENTLDAMKQYLTYVKRQYFPDITGNIGYGYNNTRSYSNNNLNMFVDMSSTVNIKQLKHEIDRGHANVDLASNEIDLFKQNLYFEVKKCYLNVNRSSRQITNSKARMENALKDFEMVTNRYHFGNSDYIALQTTRKNYTDAKIDYVNTIYDYNIALANLEIAMHYHMDNLHEQAEHAMHYHYKELLNNLESSMHCECDHHHDDENIKNINRKKN